MTEKKQRKKHSFEFYIFYWKIFEFRPDPDPDPRQNEVDPKHYFFLTQAYISGILCTMVHKTLFIVHYAQYIQYTLIR